ncbi:hypothetical protein Tco_0728737 [Tanacetum coccineum]|uniref:Uncharacterized protein n=1 Tax=Tanacetum coccineum TaxID=301880 RepID=A0ABQ4YPC3_9ASTR
MLFRIVSWKRVAKCVTNVSTASPKIRHTYIIGLRNTVPVVEGSSETTTERYMENYKNVSQDIRDQLNAEAEAVQIILTGIDNDISPQLMLVRMHVKCGESIERSIVVLTSTTTRMAKNEVNEIRTERLARTANPLALVAQQQPVYHPPNHPTQNNHIPHQTRNSLPETEERRIDKSGFISLSGHNVAGDRENVENKLIGRDDTDDESELNKNRTWKHIICTMDNFKRLLQIHLDTSGPILMMSQSHRMTRIETDDLDQERDLLAI